jgi:hypothetical protein
MPPKKFNANSIEARRKRVVRHHESAEEIVARNAAQKIGAAQSHAQESREQHDERL